MTELIKSPLFEEIRNYLKTADPEKQIFLYVPYIKTKTLSKLVDGIKNVTIITTWHTKDLLSGSSELELYTFCKAHEIALYINNNIHLKIYSVALESAIIATGNISHRGLEGGHEECAVLVNELSSIDRLFFERIRNEAVYVDDDIYQKQLEDYQERKKDAPKQIEYEDIIIVSKKDHFLKSALPMTRNVNDLVNGYGNMDSGLKPSKNDETSNCIYHDLATYDIELGLSQEEFLKKLKIQFFSHPFVRKIDEFINPEAYFGRVKEWIQKNCTTVPLPRRWELTENTQTLYDWFAKLGDGKYVVDAPNHSQRIRKIR